MTAAIPPREDCVVPHMLQRRVDAAPDEIFAVFADGSAWTIQETQQRAFTTAAALRSLGVCRGDTVFAWLPNGPQALGTWFGANQLGAIYVPVNTAYRGGLLEHVLRNSRARVAVVHASLVDRLRDVDLAEIQDIVIVGGMASAPGPGVTVHEEALLVEQTIPDEVRTSPAEPWDTCAVLYTSGTTGPSKGVVVPYLHIWATGTQSFADLFGPGDRCLINLPLFHAGGTIGVVGCLWLQGASVAIVDRFDTESFWEVINRFEVSVVTLLGVMANFLLSVPPGPADSRNPLRTVFMVPLVERAAEFGRRFGCDIYTGFNMTEISCPLISDKNPTAVGACGTPREGVNVRLVDEHDVEVPPGAVGELIVRTDMPWAQNAGYWQDPAATAAAWRNGWFHTGDAFRIDDEGNYHFVDRKKDALRRRGENISSFEVEYEVCAHPAVREAAVVGVPSPYGEDDVMAIVALVPGAELSPADLVEFLRPRLAHFMIPRYVRVLDELPKTPTNKVLKHELRVAGVTRDSWDREAAGIHVRSDSSAGTPVRSGS